MIGILFIARLGSTRLQQKHLIKAEQKAFIEWLVARFAYEFEKEISNEEVKLILTTSILPENKQFEKILQELPVEVFYGNDGNIPWRQLECAEAYNLQGIISIDGDDILCSTSGARLLFNELTKKGRPYVKTSGLPFGMNSMGWSTSFLKNAIGEIKSDILETGWGRIFENQAGSNVQINGYPENSNLRFTLDYPDDAKFFRSIIKFLGDKTLSISDEELIKIVMENRFYEINASLHKEYWSNFNKGKDAETRATGENR